MSLRAKLIIVTLFVALVPLLVSAVTTLRIHQSAYDDSVNSSQRSYATQASLTVREIENAALRQFNRAAQAVPWTVLDDEQLTGALNLLYSQDDGIAVVALFDEKGDSVIESVFAGADYEGPHPTGSTDLLVRLYKASSLQLDKGGESTIGTAFIGNDNQTVLVPILTEVQGRDGATWTVAVAWSIQSICRAIAVGASSETRTLLIDDEGRVLCPAEGLQALQSAPSAVMDEIASKGDNARLRYSVNETMYSAIASRPTTDWVLLVEQPTALAEAPSKRMLKQSIFWIAVGLVIAVFAGLYLANGISGRVRVLAKGAEILGSGDLTYRIAEGGDDELSMLGATFNTMGAELEKRRTEIEAWNVTLQDKVEERTRELESAQKQLLESQKISAVSSLAAGLAHEINNPLTGVLGLTQILRGRFAKQEGTEKTVKSLTSIETQAVRIREIVMTLQNLSEEASGAVSAIDVKDFVHGVKSLMTGQAADKNVKVVTDADRDLPEIAGDVEDLRRAFMHLLKNALAACKDDDTITISTSAVGDNLVKIAIEDTGVGIAKEHIDRVFEPFFTTKQEWGGKGLGLTEAYRAIEQQNGRMELQSEEGKGTTVSVIMPVYRGGAHLE